MRSHNFGKVVCIHTDSFNFSCSFKLRHCLHSDCKNAIPYVEMNTFCLYLAVFFCGVDISILYYPHFPFLYGSEEFGCHLQFVELYNSGSKHDFACYVL